MEDDEHNSWPRMVRTELKIQEIGACQLHPNGRSSLSSSMN
jgi:hypothetical protein